MKKILPIFILLMSGGFGLAFGQSYQGLYVNNFHEILGNAEKEKELLTYAQKNGFNALTLYKISKMKLAKDANQRKLLSCFIRQAKENYGIKSVGAVGETYASFRDNIHIYNKMPDLKASERFDVYNLEFEFWNHKGIEKSDGYYDRYLKAQGLPATTEGAWTFVKSQLREIKKAAAEIPGTETEIYVGWISEQACKELPDYADRILTAVYVDSAASPEKKLYAWEKQKQRLEWLASSGKKVNVIPIFASVPAFMGNWMRENNKPIQKAQEIYSKGFTEERESWKSNINLLGFQWYRYSDMPR